MPKPSPQPSTGVEPSAEAIKRWRDQFGGGMVPFDTAYFKALSAGATPADAQTAGVIAVFEAVAPAIHAAGVLEGRAAMRDEIVEWLRHGLVGVDSCSPDAIANGIVQKWGAIEAAFPTTGEKTDD